MLPPYENDFCSVYILFSLTMLYFPKIHNEITNISFKLLDDLNSAQTYN